MQKHGVRLIFRRFLDQERTPACTAISLLTTTLIWPAVVVLVIHKPEAWGEMAQFASLVIVLLLGVLTNSVAGAAAYGRREYWGGRIAGIGVGVWLLTVFMLVILKQAWFARP